MQKIAIGIGLAGLLLVALPDTSAQAMLVAPPSKALIGGPSNLIEASWRQCRRDRWGELRCRRCWRNRWGQIRCGSFSP
jgi:hypothetical protein